MTINEEPSTTTDASPTSTSPTPTTGPSSSPPPCSSGGHSTCKEGGVNGGCDCYAPAAAAESAGPVNGDHSGSYLHYDAVSPAVLRRADGGGGVRPSVVTFKEPSYIEYGEGNNGYDLERSNSLKGITVHKGRLPGGGAAADIAADRHYESYL